MQAPHMGEQIMKGLKQSFKNILARQDARNYRWEIGEIPPPPPPQKWYEDSNTSNYINSFSTLKMPDQVLCSTQTWKQKTINYNNEQMCNPANNPFQLVDTTSDLRLKQTTLNTDHSQISIINNFQDEAEETKIPEQRPNGAGKNEDKSILCKNSSNDTPV